MHHLLDKSIMADRAVLVGGLSVIAGALLLNHFQDSQATGDAATVATVTSTGDGKEASINQEQYPEEIKHEIHSRVKTFFSEDGFKKLQDSFIIVSQTKQ